MPRKSLTSACFGSRFGHEFDVLKTRVHVAPNVERHSSPNYPVYYRFQVFIIVTFLQGNNLPF